MDTLGTRLRALREAKGLTLEYVANKVGTTKVSIMRYEKDKREPKGEMLSLLANFFGVSVDYLLGRNSEQKHPTNDNGKYTPELTKKDSKRLDKIIDNFENGLEGAVMLDGEILDDHTRELLIQSVRSIYEFAIKDNKKYTPKKHRK